MTISCLGTTLILLYCLECGTYGELIHASATELGKKLRPTFDPVNVPRPCEGKEGSPETLLADEHRLFRQLMKNYEKSVRPVRNATTPVVVKLGITLTQIFDVDEKNQVLTLNVWLDQEWHDENIRWNLSKYGNIEVLRLPCDHIWLPDIVLYNSVDDYTGGYMKSLAMVQPSGDVFWPPIVRFRAACKIDVTYFPFDDQICHLKLGSWAYDGFQVDVTNRSGNIDLSNYVDNGEWLLIEARAVRHVIFYACCPEPFPDVTFYLHLRRRTTYYTFNVIIPCVILSILTIAGFFLPAQSGEKVTLGLTVLLAFSVFMLLIAESMPATSEFVPLIGIYLTVTMAITSMSVIFGVFILHIHHRGTLNRRASATLRRCTLSLSRLLCVKPSPVILMNSQTPESLAANESDMHRMHSGFGSFNQGFKFNSLRNVTLTTLENGQVCFQEKTNDTNKANDRANNIRQAEEEVLRHLRSIIEKHSREDTMNLISREWEDIATVFDRFLFWTFFVVALCTTLALLVLLPLAKEISIDDYEQGRM